MNVAALRTVAQVRRRRERAILVAGRYAISDDSACATARNPHATLSCAPPFDFAQGKPFDSAQGKLGGLASGTPHAHSAARLTTAHTDHRLGDPARSALGVCELVRAGRPQTD
jgi:hypothetical protein